MAYLCEKVAGDLSIDNFQLTAKRKHWGRDMSSTRAQGGARAERCRLGKHLPITRHREIGRPKETRLLEHAVNQTEKMKGESIAMSVIRHFQNMMNTAGVGLKSMNV